MSETTTLPCKDCGTKPTYVPNPGPGKGATLWCKGCGNRTRVKHRQSELIENWNKRFGKKVKR